MPICFFTSISIVLLPIAYFFQQRKNFNDQQGVNMPECQTVFFLKGGQYAGMSDKITLARGVNCPEWGVN